MGKKIIVLGDATSHGGKVVSVLSTHLFFEWTGERVFWISLLGTVFLTSLLSVLIFFLSLSRKTTPR